MSTLAASPPCISIREVQQTVARAFNLTIADLLSPTRTQRVTRARHVAMYLSREIAARRWRSIERADASHTPAPPSFPRIGIAFARDHSSVIHACRLVRRRQRDDLAFAAMLTRLAAAMCDRAAATQEAA